MTPEEFAASVVKIWTQFCDSVFTVALVLLHWACIVAKYAGRVALCIYHILAILTRRGWRVILPWIFIYTCAGIGYRIANGLPLPDVAAILGVVGPLAGSTIVAQITRSIEIRTGNANNGSVMGTIGSIFNNFAPGPSVDGDPRPMAPA